MAIYGKHRQLLGLLDIVCFMSYNIHTWCIIAFCVGGEFFMSKKSFDNIYDALHEFSLGLSSYAYEFMGCHKVKW